MGSTRFIWPLMVAGVVAGGCDNGGSNSITGEQNSNGQGRLTIRLTDAPGDVKDAFIQIKQFILFSTDSSSRITLTPIQLGFINLLGLTGGKVLDVVDKALVPNGTYNELRLVLGESYVRLQDGRVFATPGATLPSGVTAAGELKCPSCSQSGFKVKFSSGGLIVNSTSFVTIDFDVAQSFAHEAGKSGKIIVHPVLRATAQNTAFSRITGTVALAQSITIPACGGQANTIRIFKPAAALATDTITAVTDSLGAFRFLGLAAGTYALGSVKDYTFANGDSLTIASTPTPASVTLAAGDSAKVSYQITAATRH